MPPGYGRATPYERSSVRQFDSHRGPPNDFFLRCILPTQNAPGNPCSPLGTRLKYNGEDLPTLLSGGSVGGRLASVLRGCDTPSVPHDSLATHLFTRATSGPSKGQIDERLDQDSDPFRDWMEWKWLGVVDRSGNYGIGVFRTDCWYAEAAMVLPARYLCDAIALGTTFCVVTGCPLCNPHSRLSDRVVDTQPSAPWVRQSYAV